MKTNIFLKIKAGFIISLLALTFLNFNIGSVAAIPVIEVESIPEKTTNIFTKIKEVAAKWYKTYGAKLVGTTIRNTLNRVAISAASYVASGAMGQQPTFVVEEFGTYWKNIGDAAAGDFIDGLGESWGIDLCQPPDINLRGKVSLGLVQTLAPEAPNCTITQLTSNYTSAWEKWAAMESGDYLKAVQVSFDPGASELSGAFSLFGKTMEVSTEAEDEEKTKNVITEGWLDVRNIAGKTKAPLGDAKDTLETAKDTQSKALLKTTDDPLVDAANTFLNQLAYEGFQKILQTITQGKSTSESLDTQALTDRISRASSGFTSLIQYGESVIGEKLASVIKPRFDVRSDYSILSELAICPDKENPGPNNCVIDDRFSQAISEKMTVGEALKAGYLHGDWLVTTNNKAESAYTLRSAIILRKNRIVPIGWEQAISAAASKNHQVTFQDLISCFDGKGVFSSGFDKNDIAWCQGLVDPNWVLKAPLNSCSKQGYSSQILSSFLSQDENGFPVLAISRASDYCADDKTCIKEKADGSCELYGYCNEEKRTWKFSSDSCEPIYNTCQTFTNANSKQAVSYLENTLDFSTCDSNNAGCKQYSYFGTYATSTSQVSWDQNYSIFFNNKAVSCDSSNEGCTQLLRAKSGWADINYVMDADFSSNNIGDTSSVTSNWAWPIRNALGAIVYEEGKSLFIKGSSNFASLFSDNTNSVLPANLQPINGWSYTLSADVKINSADRVVMSFGSDNKSSEISGEAFWQSVSVTIKETNNLNFAITGFSGDNNVEFFVRNLKLTPNSYDPGFSNYAAFPVYQKLLPAYLENVCYESADGAGNYSLKAGAPDVCNNYAKKCNRDDVGCDSFSSVKDNFTVAAKANVGDYCDAQCVGYDTYLAKESYFYGTSADNLIPANTKECSAENAGCASFTNLDTISSGGEGVEYYSQLRQCIKPDSVSCSDFYSWDDSQLKVMSLKKNSNGDPYLVDEALDESCTAATYNLPVSDPRYNPDCREFYSKGGKITYNLLSNTVSCSDNCYAYRLNENNVDKSLDASACVGVDKKWDDTQAACYVCKNDGVWNNAQNACIYNAIPDEGTKCTAENVGCRQYNGNNGSNLKLVATYSFDNGLDGFYSLRNGVTLNVSTDSIYKDSKSLSFYDSAAVDVSSFVKEGSAYVIKFLAKASGPEVTANFSFENASGESASFNVTDNNPLGNVYIKNDSAWNLYEINLKDLNHEIDQDILKIKVNNSLLIDNVVITEITDRYYLIKNSSYVPDICFYDIFDKYQGPNYNLGCSQYKDRSNITHNLHQFSSLCSESAVGCEQMIQTHNYSGGYYGLNLNLNEGDLGESCNPGDFACLSVKGHEAIYAIFDASKQCNQANAGCSRFGSLETASGAAVWADTYKKNLPNNYTNEATSPLCAYNEVGCDIWVSDDNLASYFKNPGLNTCVFKNNFWYKSPVRRCDIDANGRINDSEKNRPTCSTDSECGDKKCITDTNDYPCDVSYLETLGFGGAAGRIPTPSNAVGICNQEYSTCTEYIDPVSKYVENIVANPKAEDLNKDGNLENDKWIKDGNKYYQTVSVKQNKLYTTKMDVRNSEDGSLVYLGYSGRIQVGASSVLYILDENNKLSSEGAATDDFGYYFSSDTSNESILFYSGANTSVRIYRDADSVNNKQSDNAYLRVLDMEASLKEAIINYQLETNIDTASCNGVVDTDKGCILFNVRSQAGASGLKANIFSPNMTSERAAPASCPSDYPGLCTANQIIKVSPDRVCSNWLACQTYLEDPVTKERTCYSMGECDQLDDKNECANFLPIDSSIRNSNLTDNKNSTGYSLFNSYYIGAMKEVGHNTEAHFDFEDFSVNLSCTRNIGVTNIPLLFQEASKDCTFDNNINDSLVLDPKSATTDYPANGKGYLKVLGYYQISPMSKDATIPVFSNQDYYINYLVNTKNSGNKAKLIITDENDKILNIFISEAPNGWERKINRFRISESSVVNKNIKIYLTSTAINTNVSYVYFDDINIEPVLQVNNDSYVSKSCRLYPSEDSATCLSANNNVIKDGLYGYCLQADPLNPNVCLMWYPVDKIAPITRNNQSNLGYSGKFPLYYCSEANGDFTLVEKRVGVPHLFSTGFSYWGEIIDRVTDDSWSEERRSGSTYDKDYFIDLYSKDSSCSYYGIAEDHAAKDAHACACLNTDYSQKLCGSNDYVALAFFGGVGNNGIQDEKMFSVYCAPNPRELSIKTTKKIDFNEIFKNSREGKSGEISTGCRFTTYDGWGEYNGFLTHSSVYMATNDNPYSMINQSLLLSINEENNTVGTSFSTIMVMDNNNKAEGNLKHVYNQDTDEVYRLTCNRFIQVVDNSGKNMAWTDRISRNNDATGTPAYLMNNTGYLGYIRNREDVPFGASILPSDFNLLNSEAIPLRNQYSKKVSETVLAGRPYGCVGDGCANFGQCSLDPNVFCLFKNGDADFNKLSCSAGGNGVCTKLWGVMSDMGPSNESAVFNLNQLFIEKYVDYSYNVITRKYEKDANAYSFEKNIPACGSGICKNLPTISNIKLNKNGILVAPSNGKIVINESGVYQLSFNTQVDKEQQPLRQIIINWGDSSQVITGVDHQPEAASPHLVYHFYLKGEYNIKISAIDNWQAYRNVSFP